MLYIDLCMVCGHPIVLANCFVLASKHLMEHMTNSTDMAEAYALKRCVIALCANVLHFASTYANPFLQLKYSIHAFRLMDKANRILYELLGRVGQHANTVN